MRAYDWIGLGFALFYLATCGVAAIRYHRTKSC